MPSISMKNTILFIAPTTKEEIREDKNIQEVETKMKQMKHQTNYKKIIQVIKSIHQKR